MTPERAANNRKIAEWLFGRSLDGFGIFSREGARLRERDFDSVEEAQAYIDREDERLTDTHKAAAHGVNIRPCTKSHPDFYSDEAASALIRDRLLRDGFSLYVRADRIHLFKGIMFDTDEEVGEFLGDPKTALVAAALKRIELEGQ